MYGSRVALRPIPRLTKFYSFNINFLETSRALVYFVLNLQYLKFSLNAS